MASTQSKKKNEYLRDRYSYFLRNLLQNPQYFYDEDGT